MRRAAAPGRTAHALDVSAAVGTSAVFRTRGAGCVRFPRLRNTGLLAPDRQEQWHHTTACRASNGPDWLAPAREKRLATLAAGLLIELAISGGIFWSPLLCALLFIVLTPTTGSQQAQQEAAVRRAVDQVRREMESRVPVTPPESAGWMNRMMAEIWGPFVVPQMIKENLSAWQEKVKATAPAGWDIDLQDMSFGNDSPIMSNYQAFNDPVTGRMTAMECDMVMDSPSMRVVVRGSGPLGSFTATVLGVRMKGRMRVLPIPEQRMLLWSYIEPPDAKVKLQVRGPLIGEQNVPEFSFIKSAFTAAIQDSLVEPRRAAVSLDYEYLVQQAVNTNVNIYIESIDGITRTQPSRDVATGALVAAGESLDAAGSLLASASSAITASTGAALSAVQPGAGSRGTGSGKQQSKQLKSSSGSGKSKKIPGGDKDGASAASSGAAGSNGRGVSTAGTSATKAGTSSTSLVLTGRQSAQKAAGTASGSTQSLLAALRRRPAVHVVVNNMETKLQRRSATRLVSAEGRVSLNELIRLELGGKEGIIELQVRDGTRGSTVLGRAVIHIMATKDGCTLIWALGAYNEPLALRWQPAMGPWRITLPLENCGSPGATITLGVSADPWTYASAQLPVAAYKTPGQRTVVLQVMEAKELAARDWAGTSDPYVQIGYSGNTYRTRTIYNSLRPVWAETFVFTENPSLLTRRVRLDVWDSGVSRDDSLGTASCSLDMAAENTIQDRWLQLAGEESGELRVRLVVVPGPPDSTAVQQMVALLSSPEFASASTSTLQVVVVGARGLHPRSSSSLTGSERNTYASITFGNARQVTPVVKASNVPTWNHSSLFPLDVNTFTRAPSPPIERSHSTASTTTSTTPTASTTQPATATAASTGASARTASPASTAQSQPGTASTTGAPAALTPYPKVPSYEPVRASKQQQPHVTTPPPRSPAVLRIQLMDVALVPPDEDLGCAELDVGLVVPVPGSIWEQWLPLRGGGSGEVLVRIAHMAPSTVAQGALPLPQEMTAAAAAAYGGSQAGSSGASSLDSWASQYSGDAGDSAVVRGEEEASLGAGLSRINRALLDSVNEQVKAANTATAQAVKTTEELRVKLGQDVIPKVQDWWAKVAAQAQASLTLPTSSPKTPAKTPGTDKETMSPRASSPPPLSGEDDQARSPARGANSPAAPEDKPPESRTGLDDGRGSANDSAGTHNAAPVAAPTAYSNGHNNGHSKPGTAADGDSDGEGPHGPRESGADSVAGASQQAASTGPGGAQGLATGQHSSTSADSKAGFFVQPGALPHPASPPPRISTGPLSSAAGAAGGLTWLGAWLQGGWPAATPSTPTQPSTPIHSRAPGMPATQHHGHDVSSVLPDPPQGVDTPSDPGDVSGPEYSVHSLNSFELNSVESSPEPDPFPGPDYRTEHAQHDRSVSPAAGIAHDSTGTPPATTPVPRATPPVGDGASGVQGGPAVAGVSSPQGPVSYPLTDVAEDSLEGPVPHLAGTDGMVAVNSEEASAGLPTDGLDKDGKSEGRSDGRPGESESQVQRVRRGLHSL